MINVGKETLKDLKRTTLKDRSPVEASLNLSSEQQEKIISVSGFVAGTSISLENGFAVYSGKVFFNVVFMGEEPERIETGVRFEFKKAVEGTPETAFCEYGLEDFAVKNEGGMLFVTCELTQTLTVFTERTAAFVTDADTLCKKGEIQIPKTCFSQGTMDNDDKFDLPKIKKVLLSQANASVSSVKAGNNMVTVEGTAVISFVFLPFSENSDIVKETRILPFKFEFDCAETEPDFVGLAEVSVNKLSVKVYTDEDSDRSTVESLLSLDFYILAYGEEKRSCVLDATSGNCETDIVKTDCKIEKMLSQKCITERVSGKADVNVPEYSRFIKAFGERATLYEVTTHDGEITVTGVIEADCLFTGDNGLVSEKSRLPFSVVGDFQGESVGSVAVAIENLQGRLRSGKLEEDATIRISFQEFTTETKSLITEINEGTPKPERKPAISVYMGRNGDEEWDVVKTLGEDPSVIYEFNPEITFPLKGDEKILILRKRT